YLERKISTRKKPGLINILVQFAVILDQFFNGHPAIRVEEDFYVVGWFDTDFHHKNSRLILNQCPHFLFQGFYLVFYVPIGEKKKGTVFVPFYCLVPAQK